MVKVVMIYSYQGYKRHRRKRKREKKKLLENLEKCVFQKKSGIEEFEKLY